MPWNGRWLLTAAVVVALASVGFWARTRLNGGETCPPAAGNDLVVDQVLQGPIPTSYSRATPSGASPACCAPGSAAVMQPSPQITLAPVETGFAQAPPAPEIPLPSTPLPPSVVPQEPSSPPAGISMPPYSPQPPLAQPLAPVPPLPPQAPTAPLAPPVAVPPELVTCPWTLHIKVEKGVTLVEARTEKGVQFSVSCERLNLQAPDGMIEASGRVTVTAPDLEGNCNKLTLSWREERLSLEGEVIVKCRQNGQEAELKGHTVALKLTTSATAQKASPPSAFPPMKPATKPLEEIKRATFQPTEKPDEDEEDSLQPLDGPRSLPRP